MRGGARADVALKREGPEVEGRVFAAFGTPPELGNISEDSASLLRLFRAPLPLRQHCGYNLVLFIPSRMSKYFQPSPALPFPPLSPSRPGIPLCFRGSLSFVLSRSPVPSVVQVPRIPSEFVTRFISLKWRNVFAYHCNPAILRIPEMGGRDRNGFSISLALARIDDSRSRTKSSLAARRTIWEIELSSWFLHERKYLALANCVFCGFIKCRVKASVATTFLPTRRMKLIFASLRFSP